MYKKINTIQKKIQTMTTIWQMNNLSRVKIASSSSHSSPFTPQNNSFSSSFVKILPGCYASVLEISSELEADVEFKFISHRIRILFVLQLGDKMCIRLNHVTHKDTSTMNVGHQAIKPCPLSSRLEKVP